MQTFNVDLWKQAQENARAIYEEENGGGSWEEADKYEREDCVWVEYEKLRKESDNMHMRDSKGRFCKATDVKYGVSESKDAMRRFCDDYKKEFDEETNNEITNTILNQKGNDTMMNKKANERMNVLKANGIDTSNFFDLNLRVPMGADVHLTVNGKEIAFAPSNFGTSKGFTVNADDVAMYKGDLVNAKTGEVLLMGTDNDDPIAQSIINDGYVKNNKLFRRWIFAQTIKMLDYVDPKNPNRKGWEACFHDCYDYNYQFKMLLEEMHVLAVLQKEDPEQFAERTKFFNGDVVAATLNDYLYRLKKYCKKQMREKKRTYRGEAYVKLSRYGNVLVKDLNSKVYAQICNIGIFNVRKAMASNDYSAIEKTLREFMAKYYNKLPYNTPKCAVFKDAFKGAGSFYSLQNAIRWHNVVLEDCHDKYDSEKELYRLLDNDFKNDVWAFHKLLVDTLEYNHFDLKQSIANGHSAKNTTSTRADVYKR